MVAVATLGYLITPDGSPQANNMLLQLSIKKPGRTFTLLRVHKADSAARQVWFNRMLFGQPDNYRSVPLTAYRFVADSIHVQQYLSDEDKPEHATFNLYEVVYGTAPVYKPHGQALGGGYYLLQRLTGRYCRHK